MATRGLDHPPDRALARAIASETLRRLPDLDALIDSATRQRLADDAKARSVLRIALAQVLVMKTPPHAAVATALPLVEGGPRRLVHGVLGTLLRRGPELPQRPTLPVSIAARWTAAWGKEIVEMAQDALGRAPTIDLTYKPQATPRIADGESRAPLHLRLASVSDVSLLPGFAEGDFWVQNLAASVPARLLGEGNGRSALDLCAAPGGKTMQLAAAGWKVTAVDRDRARLVRLEDNLARTRLSAKVVCADLMKWAPKEPFDAILLDAPCSATGIFARHPDVLHRVEQRDIVALAGQQAAMIARVSAWLRPGGRLVYATCSLEPEEGEAQISAAVDQCLALDPPRPEELPIGMATDPHGWVRILPCDSADGFFVARLIKA
jgi:16S rRNA (cytosine967-C5)-methyltransferase